VRIDKKIFYVLLIVVLLSCAKQQTITITSTPEQDFNQALELLQAKKYNKAIETFQNIVFNYPGSSYAADAQFYLADAYYSKKDYQSAIAEFEFFINSFAGNQNLEEAYYKRAVAYYNIVPAIVKDQTMLSKTIEILDELEERFPNTHYKQEITQLRQKIADRWAEKSYNTGELYFKGGEYSASRVYFDFVLKEYPQTKWVNNCKFYIAQIYERTDSLAQAESLYHTLLSDSTDVKIRKLAQEHLTKLEPK
jgi:outer membrane protein assembly factor BamD